MSRTRIVLGGVAAAFLALSALAHGLGGWPAQRTALHAIGADPALVHALGAGWLFGSVAMGVFAVLGLRAARLAWRGSPDPPGPMRLVGGAYAAFGLAAIAAQRGNWFFLVFVIPGLVLVWSAGGSPRTGPADQPARS